MTATPVREIPTSWLHRFHCSLGVICGSLPPLELTDQYVAGDTLPLTQWVSANTLSRRDVSDWSTTTGVIEAAKAWAGHPVEGKGHLDRDDREVVVHGTQKAEPLAADALVEQLSEALRHSVNQLDKWQDTYGKWTPEWLPPAGDVKVAEMAGDALTAAREYFAKGQGKS